MEHLLNKIHQCGALVLLGQLPDNSVSIVTDPPFGVGHPFQVNGVNYWKEPRKTATAYWNWFDIIYQEMRRVCAVGGLIALYQSFKYAEYCQEWFGTHSKLSATQRSKFLHSQLLILQRKTTKGITRVEDSEPYIYTRTTKEDRSGHNALKPIAESQQIIRLYTPPDAIICDPFCGGGSTAVAAHREGRRWICGELFNLPYEAALKFVAMNLES